MGKRKHKSDHSEIPKREKRWSRDVPSEEEEEQEEEEEELIRGRSRRTRSLVTTSYKEPSDIDDNISEQEEVADPEERLDNNGYDDESEIEEEGEEEDEKLPVKKRAKILDDDDDDDDDDDVDDENNAHDLEDIADEEQQDQPDVEESSHVEPERSTRSRSRKRKSQEDDDEYYSEGNTSEDYEDDDFENETDDSINRKPRPKPFIVKDDDEDGDYEDEEYGSPRKHGRSKSSKRRGLNLEIDGNFGIPNDLGNTDADQALDIHDELADLRDEDNTYKKSKLSRLRANTKKVDYSLPPPLGDNALSALSNDNNSYSSRRRTGTSLGPIRRLYPTGGPFGGGDVVSIFNQQSGVNSITSNQLTGNVDSDSSDDEILPVNGVSARRSSSTIAPFNSKQKKSANADTDPLGVDMDIDFSHVGGLSNYIDQLKEMVALPLLYPEVYQRFGITPPRGVLFHGPPGTGKTLMARALAASCSSKGQKITFFMRKGADCLSKWVGEAERQLRLLFEEAKKQQPCIIFFDEIDGLAPVRSSKQEQIHASIVSTLLALMDGMDNRGQVIVIGATNRPDAVDPALRRPGRFDREFYFPLPDIKAREEILEIHTKKWDPPLPQPFLSKVAQLTKGYGGADLRALCTEAALNSIQRRYPQIYASNDKLKIDPTSISVSARDFMSALDKIVPSSARSLSSGSAPIPEHLTSLLEEPLSQITGKLDKLIPRTKKLSTLEEAKYVDPTENDEDGGFGKHELIKRLESSRVHRPRLLICGQPGNGQQYLGSAVLNYLEGFNVQSLDLSSLFNDPTRSVENAIIQSFVEARRHKPSIIFIPNVDIWYETIPESAKSTLAGLLRSLSSNERILLLGVCDLPKEELSTNLKLLFGLTDNNIISLQYANQTQRLEFFKPLWKALQMKPTEYLDSRKERKLEELEKIDVLREDKEKDEDLRAFEKQDMQLRNTLKIKLSGLMDLLKPRYKRFKKPIIDDIHLEHFFDGLPLDAPPPAYSKDGDMILENATGRKFYNIDLDTIEERLWNGYYLQPKEFLRDIEMIYKDCITFNERDRIIKASEMFSNTQVYIEEISIPEFIDQCKALKRRELKRHAILSVELRKRQKEEAEKLHTIQETDEGVELNGVAAGSQLQLQAKAGEHAENVESDVVLDMSQPQATSQESDITLVSSLPEPITQVEAHEPEAAQEPIQAQEKADVQLQSAQEVTRPSSTKIDKVEENGEDKEPEEEEEEEEEEPTFELDLEGAVVNEQLLAEESSELSVEELEQLNAALMEIVWEDHTSWNRNCTLEKINNEIANITFALKKSKEYS